MIVKIRTKEIRFSIPVPVALIGFAIKLIPNRVFDQMRVNTPNPYCSLITKENFKIVLVECFDILKANKGLEIVHVEAKDGTFVSIKL